MVVDLNTHVNKQVLEGEAPDVELRPLYDGSQRALPYRGVTRVDTGEVLSVVSPRYTLVKHNQLLQVADSTVDRLNLGTAPRGVYFEARGARLRAIYKFPQLAQTLGKLPGDYGAHDADQICPLVRFTNSYDATNRISVEIGAFRFVCTNWAVGGGGVFAAGFSSLHVGEISTEQVREQLASFLAGFPKIAETYRAWKDLPYTAGQAEQLREALEPIGQCHAKRVPEAENRTSLFTAYNVLTKYATHSTRTANVAFRLLETVNQTFQGFSTN